MKTKTNLENLAGALSHSEMKSLMGGYGTGCCGMGAYAPTGGLIFGQCGISQAEALALANMYANYGYRTYWCCASCQGTDYCPCGGCSGVCV